MTTLTARRGAITEISYVKARDGFWYHDGFGKHYDLDRLPGTTFENLENPTIKGKCVTVGIEDSYHLAIKISCEARLQWYDSRKT